VGHRTGAESLAPTEFRSPDPEACNEQIYCLRYHGPLFLGAFAAEISRSNCNVNERKARTGDWLKNSHLDMISVR
jgi:hypothetical protein